MTLLIESPNNASVIALLAHTAASLGSQVHRPDLRPRSAPTVLNALRDQNLVREQLRGAHLGEGRYINKRSRTAAKPHHTDQPGVLSAIAKALKPANPGYYSHYDLVPRPMSLVIGCAVDELSAVMPASLRNNSAWLDLLPLTVATGRESEAKRFSIVADWLWEVALPIAQPLANQHGFGGSWQAGWTGRTRPSIRAAGRAARTTAGHALYPELHTATQRIAYACDLSRRAERTWVVDDVAEDAIRSAGHAAGALCSAVGYLVTAVDRHDQRLGTAPGRSWATIDPVRLLRRLIEA